MKTEGAVMIETVPGTGEIDPYLHIFFRMKNGEYIAFFDAPGSADPDWFKRKPSFDMHWAFEVADEAEMLEMQDRINKHGVSALGPVDHGFVKSIYMYDPNGIQIEVTCRAPDHDKIFEDERASLGEALREWSERTREVKNQKFGADAVNKRGRVRP
ncbi:glyoxalase/bleomycin resistance protein/dioxygenase [Hyphomonas johnsonii MHS-2]|uniref:Glyoxalase/bleomycin resistance protein/dioxygenase n=1 Tax=Hyphomonas johnsonii MHS-2 TaxID=1280950 RepID=A0A059FEA3_9PROT|nr:glyoxalase/bleomycin resistance protein/dioxygenase [Hyphomonas johnsonii MHS-2]